MAEECVKRSALLVERFGWTLRLRLDRWWDERPRALICMANPSLASGDRDDPTTLRLIALLRALSRYGGLTIVNEEPYQAARPVALLEWRERIALARPRAYRMIREENLALIRTLSPQAAIRLVAWGNLVQSGQPAEQTLDALSLGGAHDLFAFALTKGGNPTHPLARGVNRITVGREPLVWKPSWR
jgi:hypothetical protein